MDDLAGQVQMLEQSKIKLEMTLAATKKEHRRELTGKVGHRRNNRTVSSNGDLVTILKIFSQKWPKFWRFFCSVYCYFFKN
jgi:hypothetical protein